MNDIAVIPLTTGGFTVIDSDLADKANQFRWGMDKHGYVVMTGYFMGKRWKLARFINETPQDFDTDHKNGFKIDNTRRNLRNATKCQNTRNVPKRKSVCSSRFKGVMWHKRIKQWQSSIRVNRKAIHLGYFRDETLAALRYNEAALKHFGEFAWTNKLEQEPLMVVSERKVTL